MSDMQTLKDHLEDMTIERNALLDEVRQLRRELEVVTSQMEHARRVANA